MKTHITALFSAIILGVGFSGCATSPVGRPSTYPTTAQALVLAGSTGGGALLGNSINKKYGAPIGAVAGLGAGLLANKIFTDKEQESYDEGYAEGAREARANMLKQYWAEQTTKNHGQNQGAGSAEAPETSYGAGVVNGVRYGPRDSNAPSLTEPTR